MPKGNGTESDGLGLMTGRGSGRKYQGRRLSKGSIWGTIITTIAGTVIKDLSSPNSMIKKITRNIFKSNEIERKEKPKFIKPKFEVLESEKKDE